MDYTICSRETERDYTWDNTHSSHPVEEYARGFFAPAFEGSLTTSRFAALLRCPGSPRGVMLCVSVSTSRRDFRHRPIRTMAFLRAETEQETGLLSAFFAECLRTETLDDEESPLARAVESIYQTKGLEEFTRFCQSLPQVECHKGVPPTGWYELPRNGTAERQALSESLSPLVEGDKPFLAVLTDREPSAVLESLGSLFDHGTVRIFSKEVSEKKKLPEKGGPKKNFFDGRIGGVLLAAVMAVVCIWAIRELCKPGGSQSNPPPVVPILGEDGADHSGDWGATSGGDSPGMESGLAEGGVTAPGDLNPRVSADVSDSGILRHPGAPETGDGTDFKSDLPEEDGTSEQELIEDAAKTDHPPSITGDEAERVPTKLPDSPP